jgi:hypothetical protein
VAGRPLVTAEDTPLAGVYRIVRVERNAQPGEEGKADDEPEGVPFAVTADVRDSEELTPLSAEQIDEQVGFKPVHRTAGDEAGALGSGERLRSEWTPWLLAGLFVLVLAETVLAWFCGRAW